MTGRTTPSRAQPVVMPRARWKRSTSSKLRPAPNSREPVPTTTAPMAIRSTSTSTRLRQRNRANESNHATLRCQPVTYCIKALSRLAERHLPGALPAGTIMIRRCAPSVTCTDVATRDDEVDRTILDAQRARRAWNDDKGGPVLVDGSAALPAIGLRPAVSSSPASSVLDGGRRWRTTDLLRRCPDHRPPLCLASATVRRAGAALTDGRFTRPGPVQTAMILNAPLSARS